MKIILNNDIVQASIDTLGAELIHLELLASGVDYMWSGDPSHWSGRSPVLFPIIGSLNNGSIQIDKKTYVMGNHGFARKSEFTCIAQSEISATFRLTDSDVTIAQYPYNFTLDLIYTLIGTAVSINYHVTNNTDKIMPFQLGTHPAFNCPIGHTSHLEQWSLEFDQPEILSRIGIVDNLLDLEDLDLVMDNTTLLPLKSEDFAGKAMVFKSVASNHIKLKSDMTSESITVSFHNFPDLGIWQPENAPFLCIEPWYGHGDPIGFNGDIMDKIDMVHLEPQKTFSAELRIRIT